MDINNIPVKQVGDRLRNEEFNAVVDSTKKNAKDIEGVSGSFQGDVIPSFNFTNAPKGIYAPMESGTYNGIVVVDLETRPLTELVWNGATLQKKGDVEIVVPPAENKIPDWEEIPYDAGLQVNNNGQWYKALVNTSSTDVPGIAPVTVWKPIIDATRKTSLIKTGAGKNLFDYSTVINGQYINVANGNIISNSSYKMSEKVFVRGGRFISVSGLGTIHYGLGWRFESLDGVLIAFGAGEQNGTLFKADLTPYDQDGYFQFTVKTAAPGDNTNINNIQLEYGANTTFEAFKPGMLGLEGLIIPVRETFAQIDTNLFNTLLVIAGYYIDVTTFNKVASASYSISGMIPCKPSTRYFIKGLGTIRYGSAVAFYNEAGVKIGGYSFIYQDVSEFDFYTTAGVYFFQFTVKTGKSGDNTNINNIQVTELNSIPFKAYEEGVSKINNKKLLSDFGTGAKPLSANSLIPKWYFEEQLLGTGIRGKTVLILGDSITEDTQAWATEPNRISWVTYFKQITGAITKNYARSGAGIRDWAYETDARQQLSAQVLDAIADGIQPDLIIIAIGTNDSYWESILGDYDATLIKNIVDLDRTKILEAARWAFYTLTEQYPNIPVFYGTPIQRAINPGSTPDLRWLREPVVLMAKRYNINIIDAWSESGIIQDFEVNGGVGRYLTDGLHPITPGGYEFLGKFYAKKVLAGLSEYI